MGQAKLRGSREERIAEGIIKEAERVAARKARHEAYVRSLSPKEKMAIETIRSIAAIAGVRL